MSDAPPMDMNAFGGDLMARARRAASSPQAPARAPAAPQAPQQVNEAQIHAGGGSVPLLPNQNLPTAAKYALNMKGVAGVAQRKEEAKRRGEPINEVTTRRANGTPVVKRPTAPKTVTEGTMSLADLFAQRGIAPAAPEDGSEGQVSEGAEEGMTGAEAMAMAGSEDGFGYSPASIIRRTNHLVESKAPREPVKDAGNTPRVAANALRGMINRRGK